jgi:hypothetical protein
MVHLANAFGLVLLSATSLLALVSASNYTEACIKVTQPPYFVKIYLFFVNGFHWTSDEEFTAQSIGGYGRCCNGIETLPGDCKCPLAATNSTDPAKFNQFVTAMYGENKSSGWCTDTKNACSL